MSSLQAFNTVNESIVPVKYFSNPVKISNEEFVIAIPSDKLLLKYSVRTKKWTKFYDYAEWRNKSHVDISKLPQTNIGCNPYRYNPKRYIGYQHYNDKTNKVLIILIEPIRVIGGKMFVKFHEKDIKCSPNGKQYAWIDLPSDTLCAPMNPKDNDSILGYDANTNTFSILTIDNDSYNTNILTKINVNNNTVSTSDFNAHIDSQRTTSIVNGNVYWISCYNQVWGINHVKYYLHCYDPEAKRQMQSEIQLNCVGIDDPRLVYLPLKNILILVFKNDINEIWKYGLSGAYRNMWQSVSRNDCGISWIERNEIKNYFMNDSSYIMPMNISSLMEKIIMGFTREIWIERNMFSMLRFPSMDILRMILLFIEKEYIHIFNESVHSSMAL